MQSGICSELIVLGERLDGIEVGLGLASPMGHDARGKGQKVGEYGRSHMRLVVLDPGSTATVHQAVVRFKPPRFKPDSLLC
jgi:hypothetical protein